MRWKGNGIEHGELDGACSGGGLNLLGVTGRPVHRPKKTGERLRTGIDGAAACADSSESIGHGRLLADRLKPAAFATHRMKRTAARLAQGDQAQTSFEIEAV